MTFRLLIRGQQITTCQLSRAHCFNKYAFIEAQLQLFIYSTIYGCSCPRGNNCNKGGVILQLKMFTIKVLSKNFTVTKNLLTPAAETQTVVQPLLLRTGRHSMTEKLGWPRSALASGFSLTILPTLAPLQYSRKRHPSQEGTLLLPPDTPSWCAILSQIYQPVKLLCLG